MEPTSTHPLDDPVWAALRGPQRAFAVAEGGTPEHPAAVRFDPRRSVFGTITRLDEEGWAAAAALVARHGPVVVPAPHQLDPPASLAVDFRARADQMVLSTLRPQRLPAGCQAERLTEADAVDVMALVALTQPGPFLPGTLTIGRYWGVRRHGELVAMAGERLQLDDHVEISAVATHPRARGNGLAGALTTVVAEQAQLDGRTAFLHVAHGNPARALYDRLGFVVRREVTFQSLRDPDGPGLPRPAPLVEPAVPTAPEPDHAAAEPTHDAGRGAGRDAGTAAQGESPR